MRKTTLGVALFSATFAVAAPLPPERPRDLSRWEGWISIEPRRWPKAPEPPTAVAPASPACLAGLAELGVEATAAEPPASGNAACLVEQPVRLKSIRAGAATVRIAGEPLVACAFAAQFGAFVREAAAPLARGATGAELQAIEAGGGYECRPRNRVPGAKISAHGRGLALDVAALTLSDGRRAAIGKAEGAPARLVEAMRRAACGYFLTVLGPGADAAHADHLHLDLEPHGTRGTARLCQ